MLSTTLDMRGVAQGFGAPRLTAARRQLYVSIGIFTAFFIACAVLVLA